MRVFEAAFQRARFLRGFIHALRKSVDTAARMQSQCLGAIVSRTEHETVQQILHAVRVPAFEIDAGALYPRRLGRNFKFFLDVLAVFQNRDGREYLRGAGRGKRGFPVAPV